MATLVHSLARPVPASRRILGINFFSGNAPEAIERISHGGLLVVPAAPALRSVAWDLAYREALCEADVCIPDSGYMVLIWNRLQGDCLKRLSGLEYLRDLLEEPSVRTPGNTVWIMPSQESAQRNELWLREQGIKVPTSCLYIAPIYPSDIEDIVLISLLEELQPLHIIVALGGGTQERLGLYLKRSLRRRPSIHCIGAAIAFLSGDQVLIPRWADHLFLGWFFRCLSKPSVYIPRYWGARQLLSLIFRYRSEMPPLSRSRT
jgi:N-acetylglucosaminyldiphosphoundecaprenol N-acetyl-beta-D-mannosaminyltransferase